MCVSFWDKTLFACLANFLSISRAGAALHSCAQELLQRQCMRRPLAIYVDDNDDNDDDEDEEGENKK